MASTREERPDDPPGRRFRLSVAFLAGCAVRSCLARGAPRFTHGELYRTHIPL